MCTPNPKCNCVSPPVVITTVRQPIIGCKRKKEEEEEEEYDIFWAAETNYYAPT